MFHNILIYIFEISIILFQMIVDFQRVTYESHFYEKARFLGPNHFKPNYGTKFRTFFRIRQIRFWDKWLGILTEEN